LKGDISVTSKAESTPLIFGKPAEKPAPEVVAIPEPVAQPI
jgi:hypothetical protein